MLYSFGRVEVLYVGFRYNSTKLLVNSSSGGETIILGYELPLFYYATADNFEAGLKKLLKSEQKILKHFCRKRSYLTIF